MPLWPDRSRGCPVMTRRTHTQRGGYECQAKCLKSITRPERFERPTPQIRSSWKRQGQVLPQARTSPRSSRMPSRRHKSDERITQRHLPSPVGLAWAN